MAAHLSGIGAPITASATVNKVTGMTLIGLLIASSVTAATVQVYDSNGVATTTPLTGLMTLGTSTGPVFLPLYLACQQGHYIVITGTVNLTPIVG